MELDWNFSINKCRGGGGLPHHDKTHVGGIYWEVQSQSFRPDKFPGARLLVWTGDCGDRHINFFYDYKIAKDERHQPSRRYIFWYMHQNMELPSHIFSLLYNTYDCVWPLGIYCIRKWFLGIFIGLEGTYESIFNANRKAYANVWPGECKPDTRQALCFCFFGFRKFNVGKFIYHNDHGIT